MLQRGAMAMPADVYSFAMLMLELWKGDIIYKGVNTHQVCACLKSSQALPLFHFTIPVKSNEFICLFIISALDSKDRKLECHKSRKNSLS